jgi:hypothetical protein
MLQTTRVKIPGRDHPRFRALPPQALAHTEQEVQENMQQFLKRMLLNWDAFAPVTMFKVFVLTYVDKIILPTENCSTSAK